MLSSPFGPSLVLHEGAKHIIDARLIAAAFGTEEGEHIAVKFDADVLFVQARSPNSRKPSLISDGRRRRIGGNGCLDVCVGLRT